MNVLPTPTGPTNEYRTGFALSTGVTFPGFGRHAPGARNPSAIVLLRRLGSPSRGRVPRLQNAESSAPVRKRSHGGEGLSAGWRRDHWWRVCVAGLVVVVFLIDVAAPEEIVVPMFYVLPTLLFMWAGRCWEPALVAGMATVLTLVGLHIGNPAGAPATAVANRSLEIVGIWLAAGVVMLHRVQVDRSNRQVAREHAQRESAERRLQAQAALTHLGQLAAVVAHEVRNPLAGVRGSLEILKSRLATKACERDVIDTMIHRLDALSAKVTDILVYSRPSEPKTQSVDVEPLVLEAGASARAASGSTAPPITVRGARARVQADPEMLRPVLLNLLLNAYQAGGTEQIEVAVSGDGDMCIVAIKDRGPGIPPAIRERILEPFYTTKAEGTGLGLPVVNRLMQLQGGSLRLRDRAGGGTVAELTLPAA